MSQRPRSHQLEELSVRRFEESLPDAWVSRMVTPDYGIDREVEVFSPDGSSTGLKFAVQLKATDDEGRGDLVRLKVSQLDYMLDYELPVIVVRYESTTATLRWKWAALIAARTRIKPDQVTFSYRFDADDLWADTTPRDIERTLRARRALRSFPSSVAIPVQLQIADELAVVRYPIERLVRRIIAASSNTLAETASASADLEIYIRLRGGFLSVDFGMLGGVSFDVDPFDSEQLTSAILYGLTSLLARKRLFNHARAIGRVILEERRPANDAQLAALASYAFIDDAMAQAELAILNDLHAPDSLVYPMIVGKLLQAGKSDTGLEAVSRFFGAALEAAAGDPSRQASIHYSTANAMRALHPSRAVFNYNRARHLRPAYPTAEYFLSELGGAFFHAKRFKCSATAYSRALAIAPSDRLHLCLGDAWLYLGSLEAAAKHFDLASESDVPQLGEEAVVKFELCNMLMRDHGQRMCADWSKPMGDTPPGADNRSLWFEHLAKVNGLDPLAHFNLGVSEAGRGDYGAALGHFVACAVVQSNDVEAWANAVICGLQTRQEAMALALLHLAIEKAGLDAYDSLRSNLVSQGAAQALIAELDKIAMAADKRRSASMSEEITLRLLDGDSAVVINREVDS